MKPLYGNARQCDFLLNPELPLEIHEAESDGEVSKLYHHLNPLRMPLCRKSRVVYDGFSGLKMNGPNENPDRIDRWHRKFYTGAREAFGGQR